MDTALKHRITGAVILVGLAVLLLPELFSGAGQPPSTTVGLEDSEVPLREVKVDLTEDAVVEAPIVDEAPVPVAAPSTAQAESTVELPSVAPVPPPVSAPAPATVAPEQGGFFVQVGVFSNRQGAEQVASGLRSKGFKVRIVTAERAQPLHRVWVGPAKDRAAAEALLRQVRASGQSGMVVSS